MIIAETPKRKTTTCRKCGETRYIRSDSRDSKWCLKCWKDELGRLNKLRGCECRNWKGGRRIGNGGYVEIYLQPDDFFFPMAGSNHYVKEHRLIVAKSINRNLHRWEQVHHINGNIQDNRIENLLLRDSQSHNKKYGVAYQEGYSKGYAQGYADARKIKSSYAKSARTSAVI